MRALLQRVTRASVTVDGEVVGAIEGGLLVFAGVAPDDTAEDVAWLANKIANLRIFADDDGRMNRSVGEAGGRLLLVSQFTLHGDVRRGRRPSFSGAAAPENAVPMLAALKASLEAEGLSVAEGRFGADMKVALLNDGPVTLWVDSADRPRGNAASEPSTGAAATPDERMRSGRLRLLGEDSPLEHIPLVLASGSPRRRDLLRELGLRFTIYPPNVDEQHDVPTDPEAHASVLAERKARVAATKFQECVVLAADTIVVRDQEILGKPGDEAEALEMLRSLVGREHRVLTGVCVGHAARASFTTCVVSTKVRLRAVDDDELRRYVATGEPMGKAGAYAIQGLGGLLVAGIEGDYSNVVGLPLGVTLDLLESALGVRAI